MVKLSEATVAAFQRDGAVLIKGLWAKLFLELRML